MATDMNEIWKEIKIELQKISSKIARSLNNPAAKSEIENLEKELSIKLPNSVREYFETFNGQKHKNFEITFIGGNSLLPISEIIKTYKLQIELFSNEPDL